MLEQNSFILMVICRFYSIVSWMKIDLKLKKIEFFKNGSVIFANSDQECEYPILSGYAYPSNEEINQDNQFEIINITKEEFYKIWEEIALYHNK